MVQPSLKNGENLARLHRPDPKNEKVIHKQKMALQGTMRKSQCKLLCEELISFSKWDFNTPTDLSPSRFPCQSRMEQGEKSWQRNPIYHNLQHWREGGGLDRTEKNLNMRMGGI